MITNMLIASNPITITLIRNFKHINQNNKYCQKDMNKITDKSNQNNLEKIFVKVNCNVNMSKLKTIKKFAW